MSWFERRVEVLISVEADDEDEAGYTLEERWPSNQIAGVSVELWPSKNKPDTWVEVEDA